MSLVDGGWINGFARERGRNVDYRAGRTLRRAAGFHFTVGRCNGDRSVGLNGYFQGYAPRSAACGPGRTQFAQLDSTCWHMCSPWNGLGWGLEFERLDWPEGLTEYQIASGGLWIAASIEQGIRDSFYDGPLVDDYIGFLNHGSARARGCDQHSDGITRDEWNRMRAVADTYLGAPTPAPIIGEPMNGIARAEVTYQGKVYTNDFWVGSDGKARQDAHVSGSGPGTGFLFRSRPLFPNVTFRPDADVFARVVGSTVIFAAVTDANDRFQRNYTYGTPDWVAG